MFDNNGISIDAAPWWLAHSVVALKGPYLAEDEAFVNNQTQKVSVEGAGTSNVTAQMQAGHQAIYKVQRMVQQGTVAVLLHGGKKHEVSLPAQAHLLSTTDLNYIINQIDAISRPMNAEEMKAFLASQNAPAEASLSVVR